ncbi:MAG: ATP-binding protein [Blautia sp.]|nr:ATP-binding protein [Blautia sp.]
MPLHNTQYDAIMREYNRRQAASQRELSEHRADIYEKIPRIREIDEEVASLCTERVRNLLGGKHLSSEKSLNEQVAELSEERIALLSANGYPEDYLTLTHVCPKCQDTGYVNGQKCTCFKKAEVELLYAQSNLQNILKKENFEHFSFTCYSDTIINEATGLTARETARRAYDTAWAFVQGFDTSFQNLFLYGNTGVGKTFLSHCIAGELLKSAHFVLYFSAFDLFDLMAKSAFSRDKHPAGEEQWIYDCDLLIIDDLGTELTNSFVSSQLFLCINERLMRQRATIISTNLTLEQFSDTYSERTFSRIASSYHMLKLIGDDIRIRKYF